MDSLTFRSFDAEPLLKRLVENFSDSFREILADPWSLFRSTATLTPEDGQRLRRLRVLSASLVIVYLSTIGLLVRHAHERAQELLAAQQQQDRLLANAVFVAPPPPKKIFPYPAGLLNRPGPEGSGGGGQQDPIAVSKGAQLEEKTPAGTGVVTVPIPEAPPMLAPVATNPGLPSLPEKGVANIPFGVPGGVAGTPSTGPGTGGGVGPGNGPGMGSGRGPGAGGNGTSGRGGDAGFGAGGSIVYPKILYKVKATYTEDARQNKVLGSVVLNVVFRADGTLGRIRLLSGLGYGLDEEALRAVRQIRFLPATRNGQPVDLAGNVTFDFDRFGGIIR